MSHSKRRLAAIMFTDMVGYTMRGQKNESLSLALVEEQRKLIRQILRRYDGREIKTIGDAFLVEFQSALDTVRCAYDIQRAIREFNVTLSEDKKIHLRVGLHLGDVVESEDGDISGDAVNVASRIEQFAEDGGICLTRQVYDHVQNKLDLSIEIVGTKTLKNVIAPVEVYKVVMPWVQEPVVQNLPDSKRIAVLPFVNMSPDPTDEYFADGMTEELISTMSKVDQLQVISRTSIMQFKKNPKPVSEVSRELNSGTIIEGSVRKAGNRLRITVQMIDAAKDRHVWSESYDRELEDVFAIQSEIANKISDALKLRILPDEQAKLNRKPTEKKNAYLLYVKGRYYWNERSKEGIEKAIGYLTEAIKIDPNFALAYAGLGDCYIVSENHGFTSAAEATSQVKFCARKALELDDTLADAHVLLAVILVAKEWDFVRSEKEFRLAIKLNPSYATAHHFYAYGYLAPCGRYAEAISEMGEAKRLDPLSPIISANLGDMLFLARNYGEAEQEYRALLERWPNFEYARGRLGLTLMKQSRKEEAISEIQMWVEKRSITATPDLIYAYSFVGRNEEARELLIELESKSSQEYVPNMDLALANAAAGFNDRAIEFIEKAAAERSNMLWVNINEPHFERLRSDARFQKLLKVLTPSGS
ncbi:MAG: adenylate/guanylate cyclase domain-containing protein [Nitrososphaerales archaeon]